MISSCFLVKVHNSQLYVNMLSMWLLNILSLVCFDVFLLSKMYFNWLYVFVASIFLLFMSLSVSRKLPKYSQFFQVSSPPLLITYSSDFVSFTGCPKKIVPHLPEDCDKTAKDSH